MEGVVEFTFCADGAEICSAGNATQTAAGIKVMDIDAINPATDNSLMFVDERDIDGNVLSLKNYQTFRNHALSQILLHGETKETVENVFGPFFKFALDFGENGLPARGNEPAIRGKKSRVNCDMS